MITDFKDFKNDTDYKIGDFVLVNAKWFKNKKYRKCQIIDVTTKPSGFDTITSENYSLWILNDMIDRKLTNDEIEEYKIELDSNKYNL